MYRKVFAWLIALCLFPTLSIYAQAPESVADSAVTGSWSIAQVAFAYVDTGVGGIDASFSVDEEAQTLEEWILQFGSNGDFHSGFSFVHDKYYAGESLNLTQYRGWSLAESEEPADGAMLHGDLVFSPAVEGFAYVLSLSEDDILTLTVTELYFKQSETTEQGYVTASGEVPMTYTITLVRTPEQQ